MKKSEGVREKKQNLQKNKHTHTERETLKKDL